MEYLIDISKKGVGLLVYRTKNAVPNSDTDRPGPRMHVDDTALISPQSAKASMRRLWEGRSAELDEIREAVGVGAEGYEVIENPNGHGNDWDLFRKASQDDAEMRKFLARFVDARLFGCMRVQKADTKKAKDGEADGEAKKDGGKKAKKAAEEAKPDEASAEAKSGVKIALAGPVQFGWGHSLAPVELMGGQVLSTTSRCGKSEEKEQDMAGRSVAMISHAVFVQPFFFTPGCAQATGMTAKDLEFMLETTPCLFKATSTNPGTSVLACWYVQHKTARGTAHNHELIAALQPKLKAGVKPVDVGDYVMSTGLPEELAGKVDWVKNYVRW